MKTWTETLTLAALAATLTLAGCAEDGPGSMIEADAPQTHLMAAAVADSLAAGRMPNIDWIGWNLEGRPLDRFPLELRTKEEILAEEREMGMRLPSGNRAAVGALQTYASVNDLHAARNLIIRSLQPSDCPFVPCRLPPSGEDRYREVAERMGLPYRPVAEVVYLAGHEFTPSQYEDARLWRERDRERTRERNRQREHERRQSEGVIR